MHELADLVAPRPLFVEAGSRDEIFPLNAVRQGLRDAARHYALHRSPEALESLIFDGGHRIDGTRAYDFLVEHLDPIAP